MFKDIHYFIFDRNNFKHDNYLLHYPRASGDRICQQYGDIRPIIRLINNKAEARLAIQGSMSDSHGNEIVGAVDSIPIKIEFLRRNRIKELNIHTGGNQLGEEAVKSDIENILFDVHEEIKPIYADPNMLRWYKNFFLGLKNQAIEKKIDQRN